MSLCFPFGGEGRRSFPGILILPCLIKSAIASRMSSSSFRLFGGGFPIQNCYGIPKTTLKELRETEFLKIMGNVSVGGKS